MPIKKSKDGIIVGDDWDALVNLVEIYTTMSQPPDGTYKVVNLYVEIIEGNPKLRVEYEVPE